MITPGHSRKEYHGFKGNPESFCAAAEIPCDGCGHQAGQRGKYRKKHDGPAFNRFLVGSLKTERIFGSNYSNREEAKRDIFDYIEMFYNCRRRHSFIANKSPQQWELEKAA